jgi:outer membrane protein OmpA-like peptidoglycan-associated protein
MSAAALLGALAAPRAPAAAQAAGVAEVGAFGRYTVFDSSLTFEDQFGGGLRFGLFIVRNLELELSGAWTPTNLEAPDTLDVSNYNLSARLLYNVPLGRMAFLLGGGYVWNRYGGDLDVSDDGVTGLAGLRFWLSETVSLRADGVVDYMPTPENGEDNNLNWAGQFGISVAWGGKKPDADGDGVADNKDACPGTPSGVTVTATGCPVDTDGDGVADFQDRCADTPAGTRVDATGCVPDGDGDGVRDDADRCANTPRGATVDANGCPVDSDRDGVADAQDRCADTPAGTRVGPDGCPLDGDRDGVADSADRCPDTPAGAAVDATGCPADADGDGVPNGVDRCPNTAAGARVDAIGCPVLFEENVARVVLRGVNFATGSSELTDTAQAILDDVAQTLLANPDIRVEVGGHTDITGSRAVNTRLSQARAESVMAYLVSKGVDAPRLTARGYGPDDPVADNATREGRAQNRRVELKRLEQ